ncbi:hypothetical protein HMN09_00610300 [Mycena chlorophos]|uniref:Tubulin-tyrosine ligase n=1 Tax=Mycena chlorophos TaxID=658473 RepID=A0A8H6WFM9_MYCCL|nr:hypothetical protein HMN09_00610300 [Mycena chlorophos]
MYAACVSWPSAPVTKSLVLNAIGGDAASDSPTDGPTLFWSTYDEIPHELVHSRRQTTLASSYTFRKALIRKHFLSRNITVYVTKTPQSPLKTAAPKTYEIELSHLDELLWELGKELETGDSWWILKPGMADRGNGVRMFSSRAALERIFEEFEEADDEDDDDEGESTAVVTSQLRHFVIQEYLSNPLLFDPMETSSPKPDTLKGRKVNRTCRRGTLLIENSSTFEHIASHLVPFESIFSTRFSRCSPPSHIRDPWPMKMGTANLSPFNLLPHLTNTSLQTERGDENVRLFDELVSCRVLSGDTEARFTPQDKEDIVDQIATVLAETFKVLQFKTPPTSRQPVPNCFELFGVDFLVTHAPFAARPFQVSILEVNAEPAIELTGPRLSWILRDLFINIHKVCVTPFFAQQEAVQCKVGETQHGLIKCLEMSLGL